MDTIVRSGDGHVNVALTVKKTVMILARKPGYILISNIQNAINDQLEPREYLSRKMVVHSLVHILGKNKK